MTELAEAVLPLIRTRKDLHRLRDANEHGRNMYEGVGILEEAAATADPADVYDVTRRAIASAMKVIARADDSSGIIGDACRRLLRLHPRAAANAAVPPKKLVDWMIAFQFHGDVDFFDIDPAAYAPALGPTGMDAYRARIAAIESDQPPDVTDLRTGIPRFSHERFVLEWNAKRLAVYDRDADAIIRTHAKDRAVAAWLTDTARAFEEIGRVDLALEWARKAAHFDGGPQARQAAGYWCELVDRYRGEESAGVRLEVFRRWPSSSTATGLYRAVGESWADYSDEVSEALAARPRDAVIFELRTLGDPQSAWDLAHTLGMTDSDVWDLLAAAYAEIDPGAVLPVHAELVRATLDETGAQHYRRAAKRLRTMRSLAAQTGRAADIDEFIANLRHEHRRRPRLQTEFDKAGLP